MTSLPKILWLLLINGMTFIGIVIPWAKSAQALACVEDSELSLSTPAKYSRQKAYRMGAMCPHCGEQASFCELLDEDTKERFAAPFVRIQRFSRGFVMTRLWEKGAFLRRFTSLAKSIARWRIVPFFVQLILVRRNPLWLLERIKGRGQIARVSFVTSCPHCNRRLRVNLTRGSFEPGIGHEMGAK